MSAVKGRQNSILSNAQNEEEFSAEESIRPLWLSDYIGQQSIKDNLSVFIGAANKREEPLDHVLLYGSAGLGKTTLASIIARETGRDIRITSGPAIERPIDLIIILKALREGDVLFIDEIHRLRKPIEEILYSAMEDFAVDRVISRGIGAKPIRIALPKFTLIGATTRSGNLSSPLRARFGIMLALSFYTPDQLKKIVMRSASILKVQITPKAAYELASRARGTPRIANRLLRRVRDFAEVQNEGTITEEIADYALSCLGIDKRGLDHEDRAILELLTGKFKGRAVGLETLSASVSDEPENIEEVYEPYLLKEGLIEKTTRGRMATAEAYIVLGKEIPKKLQNY